MHAADLILLLHVGVILFVLLTPLAVLLWPLRASRWWKIRITHLLLTTVVAVQAVLGMECPLTTWENALRAGQGHAGYQQGFIADWLHRLIFFDAQPWVFTLIYCGWLLLVLLGFCWHPLRRHRARAPLRKLSPSR